MDDPRQTSFARQAATLSWICPVVTSLTLVLLIFSGGIVPRRSIAIIASGALCLIPLGLGFGAVALLRSSKQGTRGIRAPAIIGIIINGLLLLVVAAIYLSAKFRTAQQHGSIGIPSPVTMWSSPSAPANLRPIGRSDGPGGLSAIVAPEQASRAVGGRRLRVREPWEAASAHFSRWVHCVCGGSYS